MARAGGDFEYLPFISARFFGLKLLRRVRWLVGGTKIIGWVPVIRRLVILVGRREIEFIYVFTLWLGK